MRIIIVIFLSVVFCSFSSAQDSLKKLPAIRTALQIKLDGLVNDIAWRTAANASDFNEWRPTFGNKEQETSKTEVFVLYDDNAIYLAGICHETERDQISTELVGRDVIGVNDYIGVMFDTYHDQINGTGYYVTALGEQYDAKYSLGEEDDSWNSVWQSATNINDKGWTFEIRIPYSAIRFSKEKIQTWGINFIRKRNKVGRQYSWNPINPNKFGLMNQAGLFTDIRDIKPPLRLSFSPYLATYTNHNARVVPGTWNNAVNGGLDLKYGINKAFTLDLTLVPDFGQVQSDNLVLNLTPFEVKYNENRTFFNEGTELFNKGNLFYSRRIGGQPMHYYDASSGLQANEKIVKNPAETRLVNATKISGRTASGLGIGFFNAITKPQYAVVETSTKQEYKIETNPLTNYNVLVLDQTFKHNSSVTFVNTNVLRSGSDYDANVTAALWDLYDKNINYNFWGKVATSQLFNYTPGKTYSGYVYNINFGKFKGPFNFDIHQNVADDKYQQNDMGYFTNNNYIERGFWLGYKLTKPKSFYNNLYFNFTGNYSQRFLPRDYQYVEITGNINGQLKNLWNVGVRSEITPKQNDFYEPRLDNRVFKTPGAWMAGFWVNSNRAKKYSASFELELRNAAKYHSNTYDLGLSNQYRFNDRLTIALANQVTYMKNNVGYAFIEQATKNAMFGVRDRNTVENILTVKYNFNNKMGINLRTRHYWSKVAYKSFFALEQDGSLTGVNSVTTDPDNNVNYFNVDMIYTWQFAPGSFINIAWKNATDAFDQKVNDRYYRNLSRIISTPQQNTLSFKVIYFLDYLTLKAKPRKDS